MPQGPMGWRYFSQVEATDPSPHHETLDFAVDADWRIARMRIATGEHDILLEPGSDGATLTGYRDNEPIEIPYGPDVHLDYFSPATNAITALRLTGATEIDVVPGAGHAGPDPHPPTLRTHRRRADRHTGGHVRHEPLALRFSRLRMDRRPLASRRHRREVRGPLRAHPARPRRLRSTTSRLKRERAGCQPWR